MGKILPQPKCQVLILLGKFYGAFGDIMLPDKEVSINLNVYHT